MSAEPYCPAFAGRLHRLQSVESHLAPMLRESRAAAADAQARGTPEAILYTSASLATVEGIMNMVRKAQTSPGPKGSGGGSEAGSEGADE